MKNIKTLLFILLTFTSGIFLVSCKSKKQIVYSSTESAVKESADAELEDYKKQLPGTQVDRTAEGLKITFDSEILFNSNSSYLTAKAKETIKELVKTINKYGQPNVLIQGHTDATGSAEYNKGLSEKRAASVKTYAVSLGIAANRLQTTGFGLTKPIAPNNTPEGRAKNRRVEVIILPQGK
jgi:outer membrane protein OmpA-like peptidoglycan-associated protein